jgi:hypothetical protein
MDEIWHTCTCSAGTSDFTNFRKATWEKFIRMDIHLTPYLHSRIMGDAITNQSSYRVDFASGQFANFFGWNLYIFFQWFPLFLVFLTIPFFGILFLRDIK